MFFYILHCSHSPNERATLLDKIIDTNKGPSITYISKIFGKSKLFNPPDTHARVLIRELKMLVFRAILRDLFIRKFILGGNRFSNFSIAEILVSSIEYMLAAMLIVFFFRETSKMQFRFLSMLGY